MLSFWYLHCSDSGREGPLGVWATFGKVVTDENGET